MSDLAFDELPPEVLAFRPNCPGCTPKVVTDASGRPCSTYDCPGLPEALKVTCDLCMYNFAADDGQVKCDHDTCETALRLKGHVDVYNAWVRMIAEELYGT